LATYAGEKLKLSRDLVGNKFFSFCPVPWPPVCPIPEIVLTLKTVQLKLCCPVSYFLADQTHYLGTK
jgi:hypothetical protein